jgi:hypothetical protein
MRILRATSVDSFRAPPVKRRLLSLAVAASGLSLAVVQPVSPSAGTPGAREATVPPVDVVAYPGPGWRTASPSTSITFRGRAPAGLGAVRVVGSRSGSHQGRLVRSSVGLGATFRPATPFLPGERVTVTSAVRVLGSPSTRFSFTVGTPAPRAVRPPSEGDEAGSSSSLAARTGAAVSVCRPVPPRFHSRPGLHPVGACIGHAADEVAPGVVLTTPNATANSEHGPTIYDNHGQVVWYQPMPYKRTWDLSVVTYRDQRMLAVYVQGPRLPSGFARPQYLLLDRHYRIAARIPARNGYSADLHELEITSHGRAYVGAYNQVLDPVSGHPTLEYVVQQVDIASGDLLFEWHSLDHVPARASYLPRPQGTVAWDYFHGNSIERLPGGNLIISARNTSTLYEISGQTGQVLWRMGGKEDDFDLVSRHPGWQFCFQHDARRRGPGSLTVFDNGGEGPGCPRHVSRVEVFAYDLNTMSVRRLRSISSRTASTDGAGYFGRAVGSARRAINLDWFVSWGVVPHITEFGSAGRLKWDMTLSRTTYRAIRGRWQGDPLSRPALAAQRSNGVVTAWASWNGATRVRQWRLLAGSSPDQLLRVGSRVPRHGFETRLRQPTGARYVAVRAIDGQGHVLAQSPAIRPR